MTAAPDLQAKAALDAEIARVAQLIKDDPPSLAAVILVVSEVASIAQTVLNGIKMGQDAIGIASSIIFHSQSFKDLTSRLSPSLANFLGDHFGAHGEGSLRGAELITNEVADALTGHGNDLGEQTHLSPLKAWAAELKGKELHLARHSIASSSLFAQWDAKLEDAAVTLVQGVIDTLEGRLEAQASLLPAGVNTVAAATITDVVGLATTALLAAVTLEAVIPEFKRLGLTDVVRTLGEIVGVGSIGASVIEPELKYALHLPAEQQAAQRFHTRLPTGHEALEHFRRRDLTITDYQRAQELEGYDLEYVQRTLLDPWVVPPLRSLVALFDGVPADPAWLATQARRHGFSDADVKRLVQGLILRMEKPGRDRYLAEVEAALVDGYLEPDKLDDYLGAVVPDPNQRGWWARALLNRRGREVAKRLADAVQTTYENGNLGTDTASNLLGNIGLASREVQVRLAVASLKRNETQLKTETAEAQKAVSGLQIQTLAALKKQLRAGTLSEDDFVTFGVLAGYTASYMTALADITLLTAKHTAPLAPQLTGVTALDQQLAGHTLPPPINTVQPLADQLAQVRAAIAAAPPQAELTLQGQIDTASAGLPLLKGAELKDARAALTTLRQQLRAAQGARLEPLKQRVAQLQGQIKDARVTDTQVNRLTTDTRRATLTNLRVQLRHQVLTRDAFVSQGLLLGYDATLLAQVADVEVLRQSSHLTGVDLSDKQAAKDALTKGMSDAVGELVALRQTSAANALKILQDAGVTLTEAQAAIALAEVLAGTDVTGVGWPFGSLTDQDLTFGTILSGVTALLKSGFGGAGKAAGLLEAIGVGEPTAEAITGVLGLVESLFGKGPKRSRDKATATRPPIPGHVPIPALETQADLDAAQAQLNKSAQLANLVAQYQREYAALVAQGGDITDLVPPERHITADRSDADTDAEIVFWSQALATLESRLRAPGGQPPPGQPPPAAQPGLGNLLKQRSDATIAAGSYNALTPRGGATPITWTTAQTTVGQVPAAILALFDARDTDQLATFATQLQRLNQFNLLRHTETLTAGSPYLLVDPSGVVTTLTPASDTSTDTLVTTAAGVFVSTATAAAAEFGALIARPSATPPAPTGGGGAGTGPGLSGV